MKKQRYRLTVDGYINMKKIYIDRYKQTKTRR